MRKSNTGFFYLEILIALLISQWIVGGLMLTQVKMLRVSTNAYYQAIAINMGEMLTERLSLSDLIDESLMISMKEYIHNSLPDGKLELKQLDHAVTAEIFWNGFNQQTCSENLKGESGCYRKEIILSQITNSMA
jgi:Tfp pilus assembly protein PilV